MSIGTGIFLSTLLLVSITLFKIKGDSWNWRRIVKWVLAVSFVFLIALVVGERVHDYLEERPTIQTQFNGLQLNFLPGDVKFAKGEPNSAQDSERWIYDVGDAKLGEEASYFIKFKNGKVRFILYTANVWRVQEPYLLGFKIGSSYQEIQGKLGQPSYISKSADELQRMLSYDNLNAFFSFRQNQLIAYGIYQVSDGPMKFRDDPVKSETSK